MAYAILLAEDDKDIVELLKLYLEIEGFIIFSADNGVTAFEIMNHNKIDLAVLDIMMPKMNGYELTKKIRENSNIPIIILSAKNEDRDKILGLNIGADDYLTKPFNPLEIVARVKANLRRYYNLNDNVMGVEIVEPSVIEVGELSLHTQDFTLHKGGKEIPLTLTEYRILELLMKKPGRVYTKVQIYEYVNGEYYESDDNTLMVHISNLREKIEQDSRNPIYIKTVRGLGYKCER